MSVEERFWPKVKKTRTCWLWTGVRDAPPYDYGRIRVGGRKGKKERAHRVSWVLAFGPIPPGMWVLHHCDTPACVRPEHLFLGDNSLNQRDAVRKGRQLGPRPDERARGESSGAARLTEQQVREIRQSTEPQRVLGVRYGVSGVAIHKIRARKTWTHI